MKKINKLAIFISLLSFLTIVVSLYYHYDKLNILKSAKNPSEVVEFEVTNTNIKIDTKENNGTLEIILKNISNRDLSDVVVELLDSDKRISEVRIPTFSKDGEKILELSLEKITMLEELEKNDILSNEFRLRETKMLNEHSLEVVVTSYKSQTKEAYKNIVSKNSTIEDTLKQKLLEGIDKAESIIEVEKLFKENKIYPSIKFSEKHRILEKKQDRLSLTEILGGEASTSSINNSTSTQSTDSSRVDNQRATPVTTAAPTTAVTTVAPTTAVTTAAPTTAVTTVAPTTAVTTVAPATAVTTAAPARSN